MLAHPQENPGSATDCDLALLITKFVKLLSSNMNLTKLKFEPRSFAYFRTALTITLHSNFEFARRYK